MSKVPHLVICWVTQKAGSGVVKAAWPHSPRAAEGTSADTARDADTEPAWRRKAPTFMAAFSGESWPLSPLLEISSLPRAEECVPRDSSWQPHPRELSLRPTLPRRPGNPAPSSGLGQCTCLHQRLQAPLALGAASGRCPWPGAPPGARCALSAEGGYECPPGPRGRSGASVPAKGLRAEGPRAAQGGARRFRPPLPHPPPPAAGAGRSCGLTARRRAGRGAACGHLLAPPARPPPAAAPPPPAVAGSAARAHWRARGPARGPSGRSGGGSVGGRRAARPPARRRRHRHLAAQAPRDARRVSGAGKSAGAARDPVGGSPPSPQPPEATGQRS